MSFPAGFSLIHNVFPRPSQIWDLDYVSSIWKIFDEYKLNDATLKVNKVLKENGFTLKVPTEAVKPEGHHRMPKYKDSTLF